MVALMLPYVIVLFVVWPLLLAISQILEIPWSCDILADSLAQR